MASLNAASRARRGEWLVWRVVVGGQAIDAGGERPGVLGHLLPALTALCPFRTRQPLWLPLSPFASRVRVCSQWRPRAAIVRGRSRRLHCCRFPGTGTLSHALLAFVNRYNLTARPFNWKFSAKDLTALLRRTSQRQRVPASQQADRPQAA